MDTNETKNGRQDSEIRCNHVDPQYTITSNRQWKKVEHAGLYRQTIQNNHKI